MNSGIFIVLFFSSGNLVCSLRVENSSSINWGIKQRPWLLVNVAKQLFGYQLVPSSPWVSLSTWLLSCCQQRRLLSLITFFNDWVSARKPLTDPMTLLAQVSYLIRPPVDGRPFPPSSRHLFVSLFCSKVTPGALLLREYNGLPQLYLPDRLRPLSRGLVKILTSVAKNCLKEIKITFYSV